MNQSDNVGLTDFLVIVYAFLKRNLLILFSFIFIGLGIGITYSYLKPNYYSSELIGYSGVVSKTTLLEILNPLTSLVNEKNYEEVSRKLNISMDEAKSIRSLEFVQSKHTKTSNTPATDQKLGELILIKTEIYNQQILSNLEIGISNYISSNPHVSKTLNLELRKVNTLIKEVSDNINTLDSLNYSSNSNQYGSALTIKGQINPVNYNEALIFIQDLKNTVEALEPFTVVSSFYTLNKPANKSLIIVSGITVAFLILGFLVVFVKELAVLSSEKK